MPVHAFRITDVYVIMAYDIFSIVLNISPPYFINEEDEFTGNLSISWTL